MKIASILFAFYCSSGFCIGQIEQEYLLHKQSIDSIEMALTGRESLADYMINHSLENPSDIYFISNRNLLQKLKTDRCDTNLVIIADSLKNGATINIKIVIHPFEPELHTIEAIEDANSIQKIDGQFPFGAQYGVPKTSIAVLEIRINDQLIQIPDSCFSNLYNVNSCTNGSFQKQIEAYESLNGEFVYVYLFGGNAAGTWFAKLIFDHNTYITRIVTDYFRLSIHGSFRSGFIGY